MAFWQSPLWMQRADSIYPLNPDQGDPDFVSPLREALRLYRKRARYDIVLTMGIRESMCYALLCALTGVKPKQIMVEVFIDTPAPHRWLWQMKTRLYSRLARRAMGIITNSSTEERTIAERFTLPTERLRFVPLCATIPPETTEPDTPPFIVSAGRTLRDYGMIIKAAKHLPVPITIVCGQDDVLDGPVPSQITILREIDRAAYLDVLRRCALVVLPLLSTERSTGQVVMLEAMAMGKPVITTRSPGTLDYIEDGKNGYLIDQGDDAALIDLCNRLMNDSAAARAIGETARETIRQHFNFDTHTKALLRAIDELASGGR